MTHFEQAQQRITELEVVNAVLLEVGGPVRRLLEAAVKIMEKVALVPCSNQDQCLHCQAERWLKEKPAGQNYIYHEEVRNRRSVNYDCDPHVSPQSVVKWLRWLLCLSKNGE